MAYTPINKSTDYFNTKLWTGTGSEQTISGVEFQPDMVWLKQRTSSTRNHNLYDAVRGVTKRIYPDDTSAEDTDAQSLKSFNADGFVLGTSTNVNQNGGTYASWNWKANGQGSSNTDGSINTTYTSANTTSGFSIIQYTGNATASATIGHGLGKIPTMIIFRRYAQAENWDVYHQAIGNAKSIRLNETGAAFDNATALTSTTPTSNLITLGTSVTTNANGNPMIAYCFADVQGFSKMGSYIGNGNADGTFAYTGFKPAFVMTRPSSGVGSWYMLDNKRANPFNVVTGRLEADGSGTENTGFTWCDFTSNGFKIRTTEGGINASGVTFIYMAFAEEPLVSTNGNAATAR